MSIALYHHPYSRAASVIWILEELGLDYELRFVDIMKGEQKAPEIVALNPMGKLPILTDSSLVVTEVAAIGLYLADHYSAGKLAPRLDDPARGTYLRWSFFAPSVIEPGCMARLNKWEFKPSQAGWGTYEAMIASMESALQGREYLLGDRFSMADVIFGSTLRYMLRFKMMETTDALASYRQRLEGRPALQRSDARNQQIALEHGLKTG